MELQSYAAGEWNGGSGKQVSLVHAINGSEVATLNREGLDYAAMLNYGKTVGGPALRALTFHQRATLLKELGKYLMSRKEELYELSSATGATRTDSWIDIEGGIGTLFTYSGKGRRELPDSSFHVEGALEPLSKEGTFVGQHICVPLEGVAIHINAFNFPCWGMLEKLAPTWLAGVPSIVKPATVSAYLAERLVRLILDSGVMPEGSLQLICGGTGNLLDLVGNQDVVTFTGSAATGIKLRSTSAIVENSTRFNMEADSLNCSILGLDAKPGTAEFDLYVKEVVREMTVKAGQKCTAIRRAFVPEAYVDEVVSGLRARLEKVVIGDPSQEGVRMGALAGKDQVAEVSERVADLKAKAELVYGNDADFRVTADDPDAGAFFPATVLYCKDPHSSSEVHDLEAFGPVTTVIPYKTNEEVIALAERGQGSLVGSLFTADASNAQEIVLGAAPYHGRLMIMNESASKESTGHGSPMPHLIHGGPGRAGGGEEMGGIRAVMHYMQRSALQGHPSMLSSVCQQWLRGAERTTPKDHPFRLHFDELKIGDCFETATREITEADIESFAELSGDKFYAHLDDEAARGGIFDARVAHGYFVVSAAAGLFVEPNPGPVLANYGLENLRFIEPVYIGDSIKVFLTCKEKIEKDKRDDDKFHTGVVEWDVEVLNQRDEPVALYSILTLVKRLDS